MLKMLGKISLLTYLFLAVSVFTVTVYGATTDFTADGNVTVASVTNGALTADLLIMSGSKAESWDFNGGVFTVTNQDVSATFRVGSSDSAVRSIRDRTPGAAEVCADNTTPGTSYLTVPTSGVHTVFPSTESCLSSGDGDGDVGGGGGGGGRSRNPDAPTVPPVPTTTPPVLPQVSANPLPAFPAWLNASPRAAFLRSLSIGATGDEVRLLQAFLNSHGFAVALTGPGSVGQETTYFGPATRAAVIKFQLANGVINIATAAGAGRVGPMTRAKLNELSGIGAGVPDSDGARQELIRSLNQQLQILQAQLQLLLNNQ